MAKGIKLRNWSLDADDYEHEDAFRAAVELELARFEHIGERFGVALVATPVKKQVVDRRTGRAFYMTRGWMFQTATVPAVREQVEPEPESDPPDAGLGEELAEMQAEINAEIADAISEDPYAETE